MNAFKQQYQTPPKPILQYQTLQVFKERRPAGYQGDNDSRSSTFYKESIAKEKDMSKMKVHPAGTNVDTLYEPKLMKKDLLETSFKITH